MLWDTDRNKEKGVENPLHWILQRIWENSLFPRPVYGQCVSGKFAYSYTFVQERMHTKYTISFPTAGWPDPSEESPLQHFAIPQWFLGAHDHPQSPAYLGLFSKTWLHAFVLTLQCHRLPGAAAEEGQQGTHLGLGWFCSHPAPAPGKRTGYVGQGHTDKGRKTGASRNFLGSRCRANSTGVTSRTRWLASGMTCGTEGSPSPPAGAGAGTRWARFHSLPSQVALLRIRFRNGQGSALHCGWVWAEENTTSAL